VFAEKEPFLSPFSPGGGKENVGTVRLLFVFTVRGGCGGGGLRAESMSCCGGRMPEYISISNMSEII
jgi:hypothetical protein